MPRAADALVTAAAGVLAPLVAAAAAGAGAIAAVLGLILLTTTPAHAPGRPVPVVSPDELRLRELVAKHAAGTLTPDEVAELIALLAKVKGIHVQKLEDLVVHGPLRGNSVQLPGFHNIQLQYTKRTSAAREALRRKFDSTERKSFIKSLGNDAAKRAALKKSGLTDAEIDEMGKGVRPKGYQIHHKLPLDDGGDNSFDNLLLIKNDPYHLVITNVQNAATSDMNAGDTRVVQWPMCNGFVYP